MRIEPCWTGALLVLGGCYEFSVEGDRFVCEGPEDCMDGYVCAGHTWLAEDDDSRPVTFCVRPEAAELGVRLTTGAATNPAPGDRPCDYDQTAFAAGRSNRLAVGVQVAWSAESAASADFPGEPTSPVALDAAQCLGEVSQAGVIDVLCRTPLGAEIASVRSAAIWVVLYDSEEPAPPPRERWWALAFEAGDVSADRPYLAKMTNAFDRHRDDTGGDACAWAVANRACPDAVLDCAACSPSPGVEPLCPGGFSCGPSGLCERQ